MPEAAVWSQKYRNFSETKTPSAAQKREFCLVKKVFVLLTLTGGRISLNIILHSRNVFQGEDRTYNTFRMNHKTLIMAVLIILCVAAGIAILDTVNAFQGPSLNTTSSNTSAAHGTPTTPAAKVTAKATTPAVKATTTAAKVTAKATTPAVKATTTAAKATATPVAYTSSQIYQHLINIAFSTDNTKIDKLNGTNVKVSVANSYDDNDIATLTAFIRQFNTDLSSTVQLSSTPSQGDQGNIVIHFLPGVALDSLASDSSYNSINGQQVINRDDAGTICSIYRTITYQTSSSDNVYVNDDLTGNKRAHYTLRGLLYYMGLPGETMSYRDSMFYSEPNTNVNLSAIDVKAVQLLYGSKITNGMTVSNLKSMY